MANRVSSHWGLQDPRFDGPVVPLIVPATLSTAGNLTYTTDQLLGGLIIRAGNGGARTDTLPTAAALVAAMQGVQVGHSFQFDLLNNSATAVAITVAVGAGITAMTGATLATSQSNVRYFMIVFTNVTIGSEAATLYSLGTSAF